MFRDISNRHKTKLKLKNKRVDYVKYITLSASSMFVYLHVLEVVLQHSVYGLHHLNSNPGQTPMRQP